MPKLRHLDNLGTVRFVTFSWFHRYRLFQSPLIIRTFLKELSQFREQGIKILGYVIMPEHVHLVLYPPSDIALGKEIGRLKSRSARNLLPLLEKTSNLSFDLLNPEKFKRSFWQQRCYDHNCRSPEKVLEKIRYCHKNPVTRGLVKNPSEYPWSSYRWYEGLEGIELEIDGYEFW